MHTKKECEDALKEIKAWAVFDGAPKDTPCGQLVKLFRAVEYHISCLETGMTEVQKDNCCCSVLKEVRSERTIQDIKWGEQNHGNANWLAILTEEVGEVAQCVCNLEIPPVSDERDTWLESMRKELIQVAAVAVVWVEAFDRANL